YQYDDTYTPTGGSKTYQLRSVLIPAISKLAPKISLNASVQGSGVSAQLSISGGAPPYSIQWGSSSTNIQQTNVSTIFYSVPPGRTNPNIEVVSVLVTDANGIRAAASQTLFMTTLNRIYPQGKEPL